MTGRVILTGMRMAILLPVLGIPVAAGFLGTALPALGYLPALGRHDFGLEPIRSLLSMPGLAQSFFLSVGAGLLTTLVSTGLVLLFFAGFAGTKPFRQIQRLLSPLLSIPHAAVALGLASLIAPSGLILRAFSPWLTGFAQPPDWLIIHDPYGATMIFALVLKEVPFLFLVALSALPQTSFRQSIPLMTGLGFGRIAAFLISCGPSLYRQIRLPVFAVMAYSVSVVDVAVILGPQLPETLAVRVARWMADPDLAMRFPGSAGAMLQLFALLIAALVWLVIETLSKRLFSAAALSGKRWAMDRFMQTMVLILVGGIAIMVLISLFFQVIWSLATLWPFPNLLPNAMTPDIWMRNWPQLANPIFNTVVIAAGAAAISVILAVALFWFHQLEKRPMTGFTTVMLYLPLIMPQIAFVFGLQILMLSLHVEAGMVSLIFVHLIFVLPYVVLSLKGAWEGLDPRYDQMAASLGKTGFEILIRVRLPLLVRPLATALAVGFAVSIGQYLPTLLITGGRIATITTEAVAISSGGDRRVIGIYAIVQTALPFLGFVVASLLPRLLSAPRIKTDAG